MEEGFKDSVLQTRKVNTHTQIQVRIIKINICTGHTRFEGEVEVVAKETRDGVQGEVEKKSGERRVQ